MVASTAMTRKSGTGKRKVCAAMTGGVGNEEGEGGRQVDLVCSAPRCRHRLQPGEDPHLLHPPLCPMHALLKAGIALQKQL